jgi:hypothetical protein
MLRDGKTVAQHHPRDMPAQIEDERVPAAKHPAFAQNPVDLDRTPLRIQVQSGEVRGFIFGEENQLGHGPAVAHQRLAHDRLLQRSVLQRHVKTQRVYTGCEFWGRDAL